MALVIVCFAALAALTEHTLARLDVERFQRNAVVATCGLALLTVVVWLYQQYRVNRDAKAALAAESPLADVVALRFAVDASAAPKILRDLSIASRRPQTERLPALTARLIEAMLDWRLVGIESTKPLPESEASELFLFWSDGARTRYAKPEDRSSEGLVVVCLHVETSEEIPDLDPMDPKSVMATLETLRDHPREVRRVDLWASRAPITESRLRELDPILVPARG